MNLEVLIPEVIFLLTRKKDDIGRVCLLSDWEDVCHKQKKGFTKCSILLKTCEDIEKGTWKSKKQAFQPWKGYISLFSWADT